MIENENYPLNENLGRTQPWSTKLLTISNPILISWKAMTTHYLPKYCYPSVWFLRYPASGGKKYHTSQKKLPSWEVKISAKVQTKQLIKILAVVTFGVFLILTVSQCVNAEIGCLESCNSWCEGLANSLAVRVQTLLLRLWNLILIPYAVANFASACKKCIR